MQKFTILFILYHLLIGGICFSQISGISGSKLTVPYAGTIPVGVFEFEPSLTVTSSSAFYNDIWGVEKLSGSSVESSLAFRMTMGILENVEIGVAFPSQVDVIGIGSKIQLANKDKYSLTFTSGLQFPANNISEADSILLPLKYGYSAGLINSISFSDRATMDIIISGTYFSITEKYNKLLSYGAAYGHYISDKLCLVFEITGESKFNGTLHSIRFVAAPGFTFLFSERLLIVVGIQYDFAGKNEYRTSNLLSAFTMKF